MAYLPAPKQWVIHKRNEMETAENIERHIDYYVEDPATGQRRSVHLPMNFVRHFMNRDDGMPTLVAIATAPIVLADGGMLAPGEDKQCFDRLRGIQFEIPEELREAIPARADYTARARKEALRFLTEEWLCDVSTTYAGKCTVVAIGLSIIERSLLPDRPAFFVTAGRRGGGKTTTLQMLLMGTAGIHAGSAAWSTVEEERRKSIMSYFMLGVPYILWDNIQKGTQISCPHVERSCTTAFYDDRKLGVSEAVRTAATTIHLFTGNNIGPKGDLASRSLHVRLDVDRIDPENRVFKHPDPIEWTKAHRVEIMRAFYTILLGNPELDKPRDAPSKTRFKMWWRLVGSAIENAASQPIDFQQLFLEQDEDDEEAASLGDLLIELHKEFGEVQFTSADIGALVHHANDSTDPQQQLGRAMAEFLFSGKDVGVISSKSIGRALKKNIDAPTKVGDRILVLKSESDSHANALFFRVHVTGLDGKPIPKETRKKTKKQMATAS
jgi:hypothetical protein